MEGGGHSPGCCGGAGSCVTPKLLILLVLPYTSKKAQSCSVWSTAKASSSAGCGDAATSLLTTQYSRRSSSRSQSSGSSEGSRPAGLADVSPKARAPTYIASTCNTCTTRRSPGRSGRAVNTYPWEYSVSVRAATVRSLFNLTLRPRTRWKGSGVKAVCA
ncbi:hypothetical protein E2C01_041888 [Portunus trituberculatus]|uniref:Secreted protein n=1 Tax=Portunus trituberculatus TaxID=210409 RepID=A0A5B7FSW2_PORTR|nr:hypothetical protein [Portunus trituberculatus]